MCIICKNNGFIPDGTTTLNCCNCYNLKELPPLLPSLLVLYNKRITTPSKFVILVDV